MNFRTLKAGSVLGMALVAAISLLPSPALAQGPVVAKIQGYEVAEHIKFLGGAMNVANFERRFAETALISDDIVGAVPPFIGAQFADAHATSVVSATTGLGRITGTFNILQDFDPTTNLLSTLQVVAQGKISGTLDLSTILTTATAPVSGVWSFKGKDLHGTFQGVFLVPIFVGVIPGLDTGYVYIDVDPAANSCRTDTSPEGGAEVSLPLGPGGTLVAVCPVHKKEFLLGFPLTKLVLFLFADSDANSDDSD